MTQRIIPLLLPALLGICVATPAEAQHGHRFLDSVARDFHRNNCWPIPFKAPERQAVRTPFEIMVRNGWERQNLISDYYFQEDGTTLTEAGKLKVRWIVQQAPEQHRAIFVRRGDSVNITAGRVANVRQVAQHFAMPNAGEIAVIESNLQTPGRPAAEVDAIDRSFRESTPAPRLTSDSTESGQ